MKYSEAKQGRVFIIRLEDGDLLHRSLEEFAAKQGIQTAYFTVLGGADKNSRLITGPENGRELPLVPMQTELREVHEVVGTGTLFPDDTGQLIVHCHIACGRNEETITGCVRMGVKTWHVLEVILVELLDCSARRLVDVATGFKLMIP